jgi:hypothetical protein
VGHKEIIFLVVMDEVSKKPAEGKEQVLTGVSESN